MIELSVVSIPAFVEPSAPASATAGFAGYLGGATFGTCGTDHAFWAVAMAFDWMRLGRCERVLVLGADGSEA